MIYRVQIIKPIAHMDEHKYIQTVAICPDAKRVYINRGSAGGISISVKSIKVLNRVTPTRKKKQYRQCHYCDSFDYVTRDHKVPKSKGGSNDDGNIVWSCGACNQLKADIPYGKFITIPKSVLIRYRGLWKKNIHNRKLNKLNTIKNG